MGKKSGCTVIAGCGRLGASIAGKLSEEKKDVMILDCDKTAFRKLPYSYGGLTLTANVTDMERLEALGLAEAAVFIAVTDHDCVNICAAQIH
ncbi:MAG: NAD-binding protein [Blautia sp.]|nr:NAD-binding protein [Blautia sp.]